LTVSKEHVMATDGNEPWADRRRSNEEEYFRQRDRELIEQARARAEDEAALQRLSDAAGTSDEDTLRDLQQLGYTAETVVLLYAVPLVDVAWADGRVSDAERGAVIAAARARGVEPGSRADRQVARWLVSPPSSTLSDGTLHALGAVLATRPPDARDAAVRDLLATCTTVAEASGGVLGFGTVSDQEQRALDRIRRALARRGADVR
jgi:hypothetical protein